MRREAKRAATPKTDQAAKGFQRDIADRVRRWRRAERDAAPRERTRLDAALLADLRGLADNLDGRTDELAEITRMRKLTVAQVRDAASLCELVKKWRFRERNVDTVACDWITSRAERLRQSEHGPCLLRLSASGSLYGTLEDGRTGSLWLVDSALAWPRATAFVPFIGPELPPASTEKCPCHKVLHRECPQAEPCFGGCGRLTTAHEASACGYCRHCSWRGWRGEILAPWMDAKRAAALTARDVAAARAHANRRLRSLAHHQLTREPVRRAA